MKINRTYRAAERARRERVRGLVSVIIPSYNKAPYILEALDSVKDQTHSSIEIVIIDDASSDDSVNLIQDWVATNKMKCKVVLHRSNEGLCRTLNEAVELTEGEYIACLAADDIYFPHKIERHVQMLDSDTEAVFVYGDASIINQEGDLVSKSYVGRYFGGHFHSGRIFGKLIERNFIPALSVTMRASALDEVGHYDESLPFEDYDMWLRLSLVGPVLYSGSRDAAYREVLGSLSQALGRERHIGHLRMLSKYRGSSHVEDRTLGRIALREARNYAYMTSPNRGLGYAIALIRAAGIYGGASFAAGVAAAQILDRARSGIR